MAKLRKGVVSTVDWSKKRVLLRCNDAGQGSGEKEFFQVLSWDVLTRVTAADGGIMFPQKLQAGQHICADCVQDQDGHWIARAIEILSASAPQETGAHVNRAKGGEGG